MPDITMCYGEGCKAKDTCYLCTVEPNPYRQAYFMESPGKDQSCEYYIKVDNGTNI